MPVGSFGPALIFGASPLGLVPIDGFEKTEKARWAKHDVHLSMPLVEYLGPDLREVSLDMHFISPFTSSPATALAIVEYYMASSQPEFLIIGTHVIGRGTSQFVITEITSKWDVIEAAGSITQMHLKLRLQEYPSSLSNNLLFNTAISAIGALV